MRARPGEGAAPPRLPSPPPTSSSSPPSWKTGMFEVPCSHALLKPGPLRVINTQQHAGPFSITVARANFKRTFQPPPLPTPHPPKHTRAPARQLSAHPYYPPPPPHARELALASALRGRSLGRRWSYSPSDEPR